MDHGRALAKSTFRTVAADSGYSFHVAQTRPIAPGSAVQAAVFVEGTSDQRALEVLAARMGCDLEAAGVAVVEIGGATNIWRYLELYRTQHPDVKVGGLVDANQVPAFLRALAQFGFGSSLSRHEMEAVGFFVCEADLEDELIRSLGAASVEQIVAAQGHLGSFRTLQKQPAWRGRKTEEQLRRFMGSGGSRKIQYARLLVDALDLSRIPRPLDCVLAHV
jgi:hypothetical protein